MYQYFDLTAGHTHLFYRASAIRPPLITISYCIPFHPPAIAAGKIFEAEKGRNVKIKEGERAGQPPGQRWRRYDRSGINLRTSEPQAGWLAGRQAGRQAAEAGEVAYRSDVHPHT